MELSVGVVGAGRFGVNHIRVFAQRLGKVYVYDALPEQAEKARNEVLRLLAPENPEVIIVPDFAGLLDKVQVVSIVAPTNMHFNLAKACLESGKHVFVEKPLTTSSKQAIELINLADSKKLRLGVGHTFRFSDTVRDMRYHFRLKHRDARYMAARFLNPQPPRTDSDLVFNLGTHLIDTIYFVTGQDPSSVLAKYTDSYGSIILSYEGTINFLANLELACHHPDKTRDILVVGRNSTSRYDIAQSKKEPLTEQLMHFLQCAKNDEPVESAHDAYFDVRICELAQESNKTGRGIPVTYEI